MGRKKKRDLRAEGKIPANPTQNSSPVIPLKFMTPENNSPNAPMFTPEPPPQDSGDFPSIDPPKERISFPIVDGKFDPSGMRQETQENAREIVRQSFLD